MLSALPLFPAQASTGAVRVDALFMFLMAVSVFFATLIFFLVLYFAVKYRRRSEAEQPRPIRGDLRLELLWTIIPLGLTMIMFVWGARLYFTTATPPADALEIAVVGKQWMWKFQHPEGQREIDELHVPVGRPVKLTMASEDVIHSFFVPAFRVKMDVVPGRYTATWFEATKPGTFHLFCAQYCGTVHAGMGGRVVVMTPTSSTPVPMRKVSRAIIAMGAELVSTANAIINMLVTKSTIAAFTANTALWIILCRCSS